MDKAKSQTASVGVFTKIAYKAAWFLALFGTVISGILAVVSAEHGEAAEFFWVGVGGVVASWVGASCLGVLAEISIKLSRLGGE